MNWYEDKNSCKFVYVDIVENEFTKHHDFRIRSMNESFLNYITSVYNEGNTSTRATFSTLMSSFSKGTPRCISNGVMFRYKKDGYASTSEEIVAIFDFCKMIGLRFKLCAVLAGKYRRMTIDELPSLLEKLDKKYS